MNMKQRLVCLGLFILSSPAFAHLKVGTYQGRDQATGEPCAVRIQSVDFEGGLRHPLNERVTIQRGDQIWVLRHPVQIDQALGRVGFSGASLEGSRGIPSGGEGFVITMSHEEGNEGPQEFLMIRHHYRDSSKNQRIVCAGLAFQG